MIKKKKGDDNFNLVVHEIKQVNIDRTMKTIESVITALKSAESVYYPNRSKLYDLYKITDLDTTIKGLIDKRVDATLNKKIGYFANKKSVDGMDGLFDLGVFREICRKFLMKKFWGIKGLEFIPGPELKFKEIPIKHIKPELGIITINQSDYDGSSYEDIDNILVVGDPLDYGLLLPVCVYAVFKKGAVSDYAQFIEIFGQPVRVAKYDANDLLTKQQLSEVLEESGSSLALMIPKQASFEMVDGKTANASGNLQKQFADLCNNEIMICILHNTETTANINGGSNAKAKEHGKQQLEVTKSDMIDLLNDLNSPKFIKILKSYGYPVVAGGRFQFEDEADMAMLSQKIIIDMQVGTKVPIPDDYFYETYKIPKPENYDELRKKMDEKATAPVPNDKKDANNEPEGEDSADENLSWFGKFRTAMADFFAPAPKS